MPVKTPIIAERIKRLEADCLFLDIKGVFTDTGHSLKDLAFMLWELGYIWIPTGEALLEEMEREINKLKSQANK